MNNTKDLLELGAVAHWIGMGVNECPVPPTSQDNDLDELSDRVLWQRGWRIAESGLANDVLGLSTNNKAIVLDRTMLCETRRIGSAA